MATILAFALADAASGLPEHKFSVLGGGVSRVMVPQVPVIFPRLSLLIALSLGADERISVVEIAVTDPLGGPVAVQSLTLTRDPARTREDWIGYDLPPLEFRVAGTYQVSVACGPSRRVLPLEIGLAGLPVIPGPVSSFTH